MSGARITSGEWSVSFEDGGWAVVDCDGDVIADLGSHGQIVVEAKANAALIASAPDLLAALRAAELDILALLSSARLTPEEAARDDVVRQVRAAIAKAEGRT